MRGCFVSCTQILSLPTYQCPEQWVCALVTWFLTQEEPCPSAQGQPPTAPLALGMPTHCTQAQANGAHFAEHIARGEHRFASELGRDLFTHQRHSLPSALPQQRLSQVCQYRDTLGRQARTTDPLTRSRAGLPLCM